MKNELLKNYFQSSGDLIFNLQYESESINKIINSVKRCFSKKNKLIVAGNGGSSSDADHFVGELTCTYKSRKRKGYPAISIANNSQGWRLVYLIFSENRKFLFFVNL